MNRLTQIKNRIFEEFWSGKITDPASYEQIFNEISLDLFYEHLLHNPVYRSFVNYLNRDFSNLKHYSQIPFLPIEFFKNHKVILDGFEPVGYFQSSGTTGMARSTHWIADYKLYETSFTQGFCQFFGNPQAYCILALLPNYLEQNYSSLVYMVKRLVELSDDKRSGFYLYNHQDLAETLSALEKEGKKTLLFGVTFALLDFAEKFPMKLESVRIIETGGMKGRRAEMTREELHRLLKQSFKADHILSEYGMSELFSQGWLLKNGHFQMPPWMKILIRDTNDPLSYVSYGKTGGVNVIDLANAYSCPFISTQDLGRLYAQNEFEILGRFDDSDARGCNLMVVS